MILFLFFFRIEKRSFTDSDSDSGSSVHTVKLPPRKKKTLPPPPDMSDIPPLQRANAFVFKSPPGAGDSASASTSDGQNGADSDALDQRSDGNVYNTYYSILSACRVVS